METLEERIQMLEKENKELKEKVETLEKICLKMDMDSLRYIIKSVKANL